MFLLLRISFENFIKPSFSDNPALHLETTKLISTIKGRAAKKAKDQIKRNIGNKIKMKTVPLWLEF
jgi:hypothetical protein